MNGNVTFACLYRTGGDYNAGHVIALQRMVHMHTTHIVDFVCVSDVKVDGITCAPLSRSYPGKWSMAELFKLKGPVIVTGLDTIIVKSIDNLIDLAFTSAENDFWMIRSFANRTKYASGIMVWNGDWSRLWSEYDAEYDSVRRRYKREQRYTTDQLASWGVSIRALNDVIPGIYSYKHDCRRALPKDARIVLFHGNPRPHQVTRGWVSKKYPYNGSEA